MLGSGFLRSGGGLCWAGGGICCRGYISEDKVVGVEERRGVFGLEEGWGVRRRPARMSVCRRVPYSIRSRKDVVYT
jgi:hypothetical protein